MYGSSEIDPVVKYYDLSFALDSRTEKQWYLEKSPRRSHRRSRLWNRTLGAAPGPAGLRGRGGRLVEHAQDGDLLNQRITTTMRITRLDAAGHIIEQGQSSWESRYLFRYEAVHLLSRCGFEVASLVGNYSEGAVTTAGQLIFEAKPVAGSPL